MTKQHLTRRRFFSLQIRFTFKEETSKNATFGA